MKMVYTLFIFKNFDVSQNHILLMLPRKPKSVFLDSIIRKELLQSFKLRECLLCNFLIFHCSYFRPNHCPQYFIVMCVQSLSVLTMGAQVNPHKTRNKSIVLYISIIRFSDRRRKEEVVRTKVKF